MTDRTMEPIETPRTSRRTWISTALCALVLLIWIVDFHLDVRGRDAFTWMDPYQYYTMAVDLASGERSAGEMQLPTVFPIVALPIMKLSSSIPAALWMNGLFAILLGMAVVVLHRGMRLTSPPAIAMLGVLCSPLLIGLSRELYLEFTLAAVVALQFALWFRTEEFTNPGWVAAFAMLFVIGLMWKMTWSLYFVGPVVVQAAMLIARRQLASLLVMALAFLAPTAIVAAVVLLALPDDAIEYLTSGANTQIPIMYLIGPHEVWEPASLVYYCLQLGRTGLFLMTPLVVLAVFGLKRRRRFKKDAGARWQLMLWAWLLTPLIVLIFMPVKEPRHIAPCIVPAVLLMLIGVEQIPAKRSQIGALTGLAILAIASYLAVTFCVLSFPYFVDRPLKLDALLAAMRRNDPMMPAGLLDEHWCHARNVAMSGFEPNEALALAWRLRPAAVYDIDLFGQRDALADNRPYEQFEDLFTLTAFNLYNRRCGWADYLNTLTRTEVIDQADYILLKNVPVDFAAATYVQHERLATIDLTDGEVQVLRRRNANSIPYRVMYASHYVTRAPELDDADRDVLFLDLFKAMQSRNPTYDPIQILSMPDASGRPIFPESYEVGSPARNIYFYSFYGRLFSIYDQLAARNPPAQNP